MRIENVGQLRAFLWDVMVQLSDGSCEPDTATRIVKLATQVNESYYAEAKVAAARLAMGHVISELGTMPIAECDGE